MPAGEGRTVVLAFRDRSAGRLSLTAHGPGDARVRVAHRFDGHQCLNIRGGGANARVDLRVRAERVVPWARTAPTPRRQLASLNVRPLPLSRVM